MISAADTNVLLDIISGHPRFGASSRAALRQALRQGVVVASEVVWAEVLTGFDSEAEGFDALRRLRVRYSPMDDTAASAAARAWRRYRFEGGPRQRIMPDFLIGAHALHQAERLLTRDRGVYRTYFSELELLDPSA